MWIQPRTWKPGDYFNIEDYNRIKGNLQALRELAVTMYPDFDIGQMGDDKTHHDNSFYADEISLFEENLGRIRDQTYPYWKGNTKMWYENRPFPDYNDLNRLEDGCRTMHENLMGQGRGRFRLPGVLGRGRCAACR